MSTVSSVGRMTIEELINTQNSNKSARNVSNELGKDDFLKLLITQLQYQNPLEPMDDQDFIAQIAQFSALEQMQNLNHSFSYSMGFSLLGKYISAVVTDSDTGEVRYVDGQVSSVLSQSGKIYLVVDDTEVPLENITYVSETPGNYKQAELEKYNSLIGMLSAVSITMYEDDEPYTLEGIIAKIEKGQDGINVTLDEVILSVREIDTGAFESAEEYIEGMKGRLVTFTAKDMQTGQRVKLEGTLRDGVYDEDLDCYHVILDNVQVPVDNIVSTQKVDLVSTEQQLLRQILETLRSLDSKLSTETPETDGSSEENEIPEEAGETGETGDTGETGETDETEETGGDAS